MTAAAAAPAPGECPELARLELRLRRLRRASAASADADYRQRGRAVQEQIRDHTEDCQECLRLARERAVLERRSSARGAARRPRGP